MARAVSASVTELDVKPETIKFDIYYDYLCPFAHAASIWARQLDETMGDRVQITWRAFPLEQVNSHQGPDWKLWEHPDDSLSQGLLAFRAAKAAQRQGEDAFKRFHYALMDLRHVTRRNLARKATLIELAKETGLDAETFATDLDDRSLLTAIGEDYETGVAQFGVFGTPTLVFPDGGALYVQMTPAPLSEAADLLDTFARMANQQPYLFEIKRPA